MEYGLVRGKLCQAILMPVLSKEIDKNLHSCDQKKKEMILQTKAVDQIYLTFSKASDAVSHGKLLGKMVKMEIIAGTEMW